MCCTFRGESSDRYCCVCCPIRACAIVIAIIGMICQCLACVAYIVPGFYYGFIVLIVVFAMHSVFFVGARRSNHIVIGVFLFYYLLFTALLLGLEGWNVWIELTPDINIFFDYCNHLQRNDCPAYVRFFVSFLTGYFLIAIIFHLIAIRILMKYWYFIRDQNVLNNSHDGAPIAIHTQPFPIYAASPGGPVAVLQRSDFQVPPVPMSSFDPSSVTVPIALPPRVIPVTPTAPPQSPIIPAKNVYVQDEGGGYENRAGPSTSTLKSPPPYIKNEESRKFSF